MSIKQISVFIENQPGSLQAFTTMLGKAGVDLIALSVADTTDFGILRAIVSDNEKTLKLVQDNGYTANLTDVLAVAVPDSPGGLAGALEVLHTGGITIEYIYSFVRRIDHKAVIIFKADDPAKAQSLLGENGYHLLQQADIG